MKECGSRSPLCGSGIQTIRDMIYAANISSRLPSAASAFISKLVVVTAPTVLLLHRYGRYHRLLSDARHLLILNQSSKYKNHLISFFIIPCINVT